jgi:hypothetical protein
MGNRADQAGVVGKLFVERTPEVPAMSQVERRGLDQLALGADPFEEHYSLQHALP